MPWKGKRVCQLRKKKDDVTKSKQKVGRKLIIRVRGPHTLEKVVAEDEIKSKMRKLMTDS
jgi:hypothetical protein